MTDAIVDTRTLILEAARQRLLADGYAGMSTRKVATEAGVPLSQVRQAVRDLLDGWYALLFEVAREAERRCGPLGPFTADEVATLIGTTFIGSEALLLFGFDRKVIPIRSALRRIGVVIRQREESPKPKGG